MSRFQLSEISAVDRPANPLCKALFIKSAGPAVVDTSPGDEATDDDTDWDATERQHAIDFDASAKRLARSQGITYAAAYRKVMEMHPLAASRIVHHGPPPAADADTGDNVESDLGFPFDRKQAVRKAFEALAKERADLTGQTFEKCYAAMLGSAPPELYQALK